jgi:hydrogenase nickel incorporation protein HypA/HybF
MHEMSLCEGILQIVEDAARKAGAARVTRVRLAIGAFSGAEVPALRFCFDAVTRGSVAEGAALEIDAVPGTAFCFDCAETVTLAERLAPCPACGGGRLVPNGGDEMQVRDIEVV